MELFFRVKGSGSCYCSVYVSLVFRGCIQRKTWWMEPYAGVDYNLTFFRLHHMYHGRPYARVYLYPMPESSLSPSRGLRIWPQVQGSRGDYMYSQRESKRIAQHVVFELLSGGCFIWTLYWTVEFTEESTVQ
jgi:hypothetical protein